MYDLLLRNGIVVTSKETLKADIAVKDGKIVCIERVSESAKAKKVFDARGLYILPGIIDAHVHFREPGLTHKEDFETGSRAAAAGGVTFFCDMPNTLPPTSTYELFLEKKHLAEKKSRIGFSLFALLTDENTGEIPKLAEAGAAGFKVFLGTSTGNLAAPKEETLIKQLRLCAKLGKRAGFHAETSEINERRTLECMQKTNAPDGIALCEARPIESEVKAIEKALDLARRANAAIHIHHVTCKPALELIAKAKKEGVDVTAETCPHYLILNAETCAHKVYPPIRGEEHRLALWEGIKSGAIGMIATDHAPHAAEEKALLLWNAPAGLAGTETFVNLMLNEVNKGALSLNDFVRLASEQPAKIWGLKQKGSLAAGADADFTIIDMNKKAIIDASRLHSKSKTSPFDGMELQGAPVAAIVRGHFVMENCGSI